MEKFVESLTEASKLAVIVLRLSLFDWSDWSPSRLIARRLPTQSVLRFQACLVNLVSLFMRRLLVGALLAPAIRLLCLLHGSKVDLPHWEGRMQERLLERNLGNWHGHSRGTLHLKHRKEKKVSIGRVGPARRALSLNCNICHQKRPNLCLFELRVRSYS